MLDSGGMLEIIALLKQVRTFRNVITIIFMLPSIRIAMPWCENKV